MSKGEIPTEAGDLLPQFIEQMANEVQISKDYLDFGERMVDIIAFSAIMQSKLKGGCDYRG
jgi:hypothetical protein